MKRYEEAATAYQNGLKLDPNNDQLVNGLKEVENEISGPGSRCKLKHFYIIFHNIYPNQILLWLISLLNDDIVIKTKTPVLFIS